MALKEGGVNSNDIVNSNAKVYVDTTNENEQYKMKDTGEPHIR